MSLPKVEGQRVLRLNGIRAEESKPATRDAHFDDLLQEIGGALDVEPSLDGCTIDIVESFFGRDDGVWGIFDIAGDATCADGGFSYTSSGAWDGNGFHASGAIKDGSGSGDFEGVAGRIAQLGGGALDNGNGTFEISYESVVDKVDD